MSKELRLIDDWYDLTKYLSARIEKFPRTHRFTLGKSLGKRCLNVLADLIRTKYAPASPGKLERLRRVNVELEVLRFLLRLAHDLQALSHEAHRHLVERLHSIGLQVGGWIKAIAARVDA